MDVSSFYRDCLKEESSRGLVALSNNLSENSGTLRHSRCGLDGHNREQKDTLLLQLESKRFRSCRPGFSFQRRNLEQLESPILVPTIQSHSSLSKQNSRAESEKDNCHSSLLERKALVYTGSENDGGHKEIAIQEGSGRRPGFKQGSYEYHGNEISRCSTFWNEWGIGGTLSQETKNLVEASWRDRTELQYRCAWRQWLKYCNEKGLSSSAPSLTDVMEYLTHLYLNKKEYRTVNTARSALSSTLPPIDGFMVGKHPLIKRQLKGIFNLRPPKQTLFPSWSVKNVLDTIKQWYPTTKLSTQLLTYKTAFLVAISSAKRASSLSLLSIKKGYLEVSEEKVVLLPIGLEKHSRPGFVGGPIEIESFKQSPELCPVNHLNAYLERIRILRGKEEGLFVTIRKPHTTASAPTIARWVKTVIDQSGETGTGGSTRSVATSTALSKGVSSEKIIKAGDWARVSTFKRHYYKAVPLTVQSANLKA